VVLVHKVVRIAVAAAVHMGFVAAVDPTGSAAGKVLVELPVGHMAVVWEVVHIELAVPDRDMATGDRAKTSGLAAAGEADCILMMSGRVMKSRTSLGSELV
jgi:hypothetical protein